MGCRFCEASLSKVLCSGGWSECSSSLMAQLQRCSRRDGRPDAHRTCWFLSEWTNNCSTFATANCNSKACWEIRRLGGIDQIFTHSWMPVYNKAQSRTYHTHANTHTTDISEMLISLQDTSELGDKPNYPQHQEVRQ